MAEVPLDQIVKGASTGPAQKLAQGPPPPIVSHSRRSSRSSKAELAADPLSHLPSSPPQIYLNLLILESSLRSQYLTLRARRRQYTFFLLLLSLWVAYFSYALFLRPREDGSGVGGSVYWVVEMTEKLALMGGVVTAILLWGTGQLERGVRWPRRWFAVANRGLRGMNAKIVVIRGSWWQELLSNLAFLFPYSSFFPSPGFSYHVIEHADRKALGLSTSRPTHYDAERGGSYTEEDLAPGGDYIKLLLLPKSFSPEFRENWDEYRNDYWEKENERRAQLRQRVRQREHQLAKQEGGWFWWTGLYPRKTPTIVARHEKPQHQAAHRLSDVRRKRSNSRLDPQGSHSRNSSRSTTPQDIEERAAHSHRTSSVSGNSERKKKTRTSSSLRELTPTMGSSSSRPTTPIGYESGSSEMPEL